MHTAQPNAPAGDALRGLLPEGSDPDRLIDLACGVAFQTRDGDPLTGCIDLVKEDPEQAAALMVTLAALVDIDRRPADMLRWLAEPAGRQEETARMAAAYAQARASAEADVASSLGEDTLPPVTLESMYELAYAARLAGVPHPCGTLGAYRRHRRRDQKACARCLRARALYDAATPEQRRKLRAPRPERRRAAECGTPAGYHAHRDRGEDACGPCRQARSDYDAQQYDKRLAKKGKTRSRPRSCGVEEATVHHLSPASPVTQRAA